jgi:hypothetical protein
MGQGWIVRRPGRCGTASGLRPQIRQLSIAQIQIALDTPPWLVLELAGAVELIDTIALRLQQHHLDGLITARKLAVPILAIDALLGVCQASLVTRAQTAHLLLGQALLDAQLLEPLERCAYRLATRLVLRLALIMALVVARARQAEPADDRKNRIRLRSGNGLPESTVSGMASAAASDTTPRTPVDPSTNGHCQGGAGSRRRSAGESQRGA